MTRILELWDLPEGFSVLGHFLGGTEGGSHWNVSAAVRVVWVKSSLSGPHGAPAGGHVDRLGLICSVWLARHSTFFASPHPENHKDYKDWSN